MSELRERWAHVVEQPFQPTPLPHIGILWKHADGTACVLTRRDGVLLLSMQRAGFVQKEERVGARRDESGCPLA
jgi:hypothetical protein